MIFLLTRTILIWLLVYFCKNSVRVKQRSRIGDSKRILALNVNRFRGDLELLDQDDRITILRMPYLWQGRLYYWFFGEELETEPSEVLRQRKQYRQFLERFLSRLYRLLDIDLVLGSGIHYKVAEDWGAISESLGYSYVVLHREGYMGSPFEDEYIAAPGQMGKRFPGSMLIFQTQRHREIVVKSGFVSESNSAVSGVMRMDDFIRASCSTIPQSTVFKSDRRKRITLFSFGPSTGFITVPPIWPIDPENYLMEMCYKTHVLVARYAVNHADIDVTIKTKWGGRWLEEIHKILGEHGIESSDVENLEILTESSAQELIGKSDVVVGYGSTTLLEAAIVGLPVIVPRFDELLRDDFKKYLLYPDIDEAFNIAEGPDKLERLIEENLANPGIDEQQMTARKRAFTRYISSLNGDAVERSIKLLLSVESA
ncbi:MAG: hypothetical protein CL398_01825 [Acidiferrobacteraceae bacterium]|nr:hypothetical protein [Acidiferrobacteraceae bacterium]